MFFRIISTVIYCCLYLSVTGQIQPSSQVIFNNLQEPFPKNFPQQSFSKAGSCGVDTVYYPYYKTSGFYAVALNATTSGSGFSQWYPAPQPITISGFDFFAWQSDNSSAVVSITCNIYIAGGDSLPFTNPVRTVTLNIDSTFGGGTLAAMRKHAAFSNPITLSVPYIITLETQSSVNVSVICNSYQANDGKSEWLSGVKLANTWRRSFGINVGGYSFNADFILMPTVSYSLQADFSFFGCNDGNTPFTFTNTSSPIMQNRFYNRYAYYNIPQFGFQWDYGDTSGKPYAIDGSHTYKKRLNYLVTLRDTMYGWTVGCADYSAKQVDYTPLPPALGNDGPRCSGDSVQFFSDTLPGLTYIWTGPDSFTSSLQNPKRYSLDTSMNGNYKLKLRNMNCVSRDTSTELVVYQTPAKPKAINDGPKCVGDSVLFNAFSPSPGIQYHWTGPKGFAISSDNFYINSLDTSDAGTYFVFVEDGKCFSGIDSTKLYTYPPPQVPILKSLVGNSLCQDDTIYFEGQSVIGAKFNWTGPNGFQSDTSSPFFIASDTLQSGYYKSQVLIGSCVSDADSLYLEVFRSPVTSIILGSDTSTEKLIKTYSSPKDYRDGLIWSCFGGTILSMDSLTGDIQVQWNSPGKAWLTVNSFTDSGCTGSSDKLNVDILPEPPPIDPGGIRLANGAEVFVYPNPTHGNVHIRLTNPGSIAHYKVLSMDGRLVQQGVVDSSMEIQLNEAASGIYMMVFETKSSVYTVRIEKLP